MSWIKDIWTILASIVTLTREMDRAHNEIKELRRQLDELNNKVSQIRAEVECQKTTNQNVDRYGSEIATLKESIGKLRLELNNLIYIVEQIYNKIKDHQVILDTYSNEIANIKEAIPCQFDVTRLDERVSHFEDQLRALAIAAIKPKALRRTDDDA